jgi:hypothetical protein
MGNGKAVRTGASRSCSALKQVKFRSPIHWSVLQWLGVVVCAVLGIYTTYISISVISHIDHGLSRSFDLASEAFEIPAFLLVMYFFSLPVIGASAIFGLKRLMRPPGIL